MWPAGTAEPAAWDLSARLPVGAVAAGFLMKGTGDIRQTLTILGGLVLVTIVILNRFPSQVVRLSAVIIGLVLGFSVACLVAARLGLTVIDGDGAGRAVPSLPMLTYAAQHVDPRPAVLVSQDGLTVELDVTPAKGEHGDPQHQQDVSIILEQMMRPIVAAPEFKEFGGLAMWVMKPATTRFFTPAAFRRASSSVPTKELG